MNFRTSRRNRLAIVALMGMALLGWFASPSASLQWRAWQIERLVRRGQFAEAEVKVRAWIEESPARPTPRRILARFLLRQGRRTEAEESLQRAVELGLEIEEARIEHFLIISPDSAP